jgi:DNA-binding MarR family transcriptional regulator
MVLATSIPIYALYIRSKKRWIRQAREMREFDIKFRERLLLEMLYAVGEQGMPQHVMGAYLDVKPNVTSELIDRMEKRYFVERNLNPSNKREKLVCLTEPYGRDFVRRMLEVTDAHIEEVRAALLDGALQEFTRVAELVITKMDSPKLNAACKCFNGGHKCLKKRSITVQNLPDVFVQH